MPLSEYRNGGICPVRIKKYMTLPMTMSEHRSGGICFCHNTEMEEYATVRLQKWRNMPLTEYRNGKYATVRKQKWRNKTLSEYRNDEL